MATILDKFRPPKWLRVVMAAMGSLATGLTALSAPQAIRDATSNVPLLGQPVPWWVWLASAVVLLFLAFAPSLPSGRDVSVDEGRTHPTKDNDYEDERFQLEREVAQLKREAARRDEIRGEHKQVIRALTDERDDARARVKGLLDHNKVLEEAVQSLRNTVDERDAQVRALSEKLNPPTPTSGTSPEATNRLREVMTFGDGAVDGGMDFLEHLLDRLSTGPPGTTDGAMLLRTNLAAFVHIHVVKSCASAHDALKNAEDDPQRLLCELIVAYRSVRDWIAEACKILEVKPQAFPAFLAWCRQDEAFFADIRKSTARDDLKTLKGFMAGWSPRRFECSETKP